MELTREEIDAAMKQWQAQQDDEHQKSEHTKAERRVRQYAQFTVLFGPLVTGEYELGQHLRFRVRPTTGTALTIMTGTVIWSYGPGQTPVSQTQHPLVYVVDAGIGAPILVYPGQIVQTEHWGSLE